MSDSDCTTMEEIMTTRGSPSFRVLSDEVAGAGPVVRPSQNNREEELKIGGMIVHGLKRARRDGPPGLSNWLRNLIYPTIFLACTRE